MFIEQPPDILRRLLYRKAVWRLSDKEKNVYITFDDGPIPESTLWILETLERYEVAATFFCVGDNVRKYPELFEAIKNAGHSVGNHTFNHLQAFKTRGSHYLENVAKADKFINSNLFRPPHGQLRLPYMSKLMQRHKIVMWDVVTRDYSSRLTAEDVVENVKRYTRSGSVIVFHDSLKSIDKLKTALPESIEWLKAQGYTFKKIEMSRLF